MTERLMVTVKGDGVQIAGAMSTLNMVVTAGALATTAIHTSKELAGDTFRAFVDAWNHFSEEEENIPRLYTEDDLKSLKQENENLRFALNAIKED